MIARALAATTAAVATVGLAGQVVLTTQDYLARGDGVAAGLWRLAGFFTIWTNLSVLAVAATLALVPTAPLARPVARLAVLPAILVVGVAYTLLLRPLVKDTAVEQLVVSSLLHDFTPPLFLLTWLFAPRIRPALERGGLGAAAAGGVPRLQPRARAPQRLVSLLVPRSGRCRRPGLCAEHGRPVRGVPCARAFSQSRWSDA